MDHLGEIFAEELQDALDKVEGKKPTQRLLAAIAYKNGLTQTELAEWYDVQRRTIYSWLKRLDTDESLEQAVTDAHQSGRKRKLSEKEQTKFEDTVHESPTEVGFDAPALVQQYLDETYDIEYSIPSCRRLLKEAGLSYQRPRHTAAESDADEQETFREELKKAAGNGRHSSLYRSNPEIGSGRATCRAETRGTWPSVELFGQRNWTCLLGVITEDGDRFFSRFEEYITVAHAKYFILTVYTGFEDDLFVVLDGAPYFQASTVMELAACDDLAFITVPAYPPELYPVKGCWRQLQTALSDRFFDSLCELTTAVDIDLDHSLYQKRVTISNV